MGQRRAASDAYRFDLVPDDGPGLDAPDPLPDGEPRAPTFLDRVRAWPRGRVIAGVVTVAVVIGGGGVAGSVVENRRIDALRAAAGGVVDLSQAPTKIWSVEIGTGNASPVALVGDLLVVVDFTVEAQGAPPEDPADLDVSEVRLRAIRLDDGGEAWERSFVGQWNCGPSPRYAYMRLTIGSADSIVCVQEGPGAALQVIDAAGDVVAERKLEGTDDRVPTADGGVVRLEPVGEPGPLPEFVGDEASGYHPDAPIIAPDLHVTMEDAATGETRWETTVDSVPTGRDNWYLCAQWGSDTLGDGTAEPEIDLAGGEWRWANDTLIGLHSCGISAVLTLSGVRLDVPRGTVDQVDPADDMSGQEEVVPTSEGQYLRPAVVDQHGQYSSSPYAPWEVVDAEGKVVASLPGRAPEPLATDGSRPGVVLSHVAGGLAAIRVSDGETLWDETLAGPPGVLVRTRDLVLVVDGERQLTALDLSSGERRWTAALDGVDEELWGDASYYVRAAFTDGRVAVVGTPGLSQAGGARYTAFDLRSGDVVWTLDARNMGDGYAFAVDGRVLTWNYQTLTALG